LPVGDAGDEIPVLAHRRNRGVWMVTMRADHWFKLLAQVQPRRDAG
jgi:hypothetical protein